MGDIRQKIAAAFGQGMSHEKVALSCTVGGLMGLIPLLWGSCVLCLLIGWRFKLSHALIQLLNYSLYPVQIALFVPFFYVGNRLFGQPQLFDQTLFNRFVATPFELLAQMWQANLYALVAWAGFSAIIFPVIYISVLSTVRRLGGNKTLTQ